MSNVQIKTLSQVHIGNGVFLQQGNDFLVKDVKNDSFVYVLNVDKLAEIVGTDSSSIRQWTDVIQTGNVAAFIRERLKETPFKDVAKRRITSFVGRWTPTDTLKEFIHDGMGRPYLPGSSIKGAIRTAVLATLARNQVLKNYSSAHGDKEQRKCLSNMEKQILGNKPETDVFRHLATGDAFFRKGSEIAVRQINLNITQKDNLKDFSKQQVVEAIGTDETASFRLTANHEFFNRIGLSDVNDLFRLINEHTRKLVEEEIDYWDGYKDDSGDYVANMNEILLAINDCSSGECVLRIGQASGWRFITGAWLEELELDEFDKTVRRDIRTNNVYDEYDFPKTRRIDDDSYVFGFVKMSIV